MRIEGYRWQMTAVNAPLARTPVAFEPSRNEVVVAIAGCGVCHTDLGYLYDGVRTTKPLPLALGHEISGTVVATGPGAEAWQGRAVIVPAVLPCGECDLRVHLVLEVGPEPLNVCRRVLRGTHRGRLAHAPGPPQPPVLWPPVRAA